MSDAEEVPAVDPQGGVEGSGESSTIRDMRQALKDANARARELEARLAGAVVSEEEAAGLRSAAERAETHRRELAADRWERLLSEYDVPDRLAHLIRLEVSEDDLADDIDGVRQYVGEVVADVKSHVHAMPAATVQRMVAQAAMDDAAGAFTPANTGQMSYAEFQAVRDRSPREAQALLARGEVELPDHVAQQMSSNRKGIFG